MEAIKYYLSTNLNESIETLLKEASIVTITDALGRLEFANKNYCKILERDPNNLIGETHELFKSHLHSEKLYKNLWRTIKMGQKWNGILSDRSHKGKLFWLNTTIIPVRIDEENTVKYVAIYNDVTKAQSQKIDLHESNLAYSKYRSIYQSINASIIVVADSKGNITEWNQGAQFAFGYTKLEILGKPITLLTSKKVRKGDFKELINKTKAKQNIKTIELYCLRKNGEQFPVEFTLNTLAVDDNCFYCAVMLDITKRKKLENRLKQKTKDLELFLYRSAHDLKAPLLSAEGLISLLKKEDVPSKKKLLIDMLSNKIQEGKGLIQNLSQASSISTSNDEISIIDFEQIIDHVLRMLSGLENFKHIRFNTEVVNTRVFSSNPEMISSIFQNLIQNAIKYSKPKSKDHTPFINISVKTFQNRIIIKVCDNGQGITSSCIDKIFDLYYRANKEETPGNGLGLYIVKSIVENLEGKITVKSHLDKDTCFKVTLPSLI
ncbi:hypothetical protein GCM10022291_00810 [Postechiella marina]|uniref:histidine kinase n=1 Tax=Postechiella marina TaxID=943941 RepID=A0ABP8BYJ0_9FLAO